MRDTKRIILGVAAGIVALYGACTDEVEGGDPNGLSVSGQVVDFATGAVVTGTSSISTRGLDPAPVVIVDGAAFSMEPIPANSVFHILSAAPPTHRATYAGIEVIDASREAIQVPALSETYIASLATGFGVSPTAARGILLARAVDANGQPRAGVPGAAFTVPPGSRGPFFLDPQLDAAPAATSTTSSGWVVFFEIEPGLVGLTAAASAQVTMEMDLSPVAPASATIADIKITDGANVLPTNVSFAQQVRPIFELRGCEACHSGAGPGRDLGNLTLDGSTSLIYRELVQEEGLLAAGNNRIDLQMPERSLVLTMPSAENPADRHPNITFGGPNDPDYQLILVWIREGARDN
jgi:hypothetical protein